MSKTNKSPAGQQSVHDRKCVECAKPFQTEAKRGRPFTRCPKCRK